MEGTRRDVGARSEGIPVAAVEKPAEKKPPSYTVCSSDDFSSPSSNPLSYDCSGEGLREEVWASTGVVEGPSPVRRTEVLGDAFSNTVQLRLFRRRPAQEGEEVRGSTCCGRRLKSPVGRTEVLETPSGIPSNYDCFGEGLP